MNRSENLYQYRFSPPPADALFDRMRHIIERRGWELYRPDRDDTKTIIIIASPAIVAARPKFIPLADVDGTIRASDTQISRLLKSLFGDTAQGLESRVYDTFRAFTDTGSFFHPGLARGVLARWAHLSAPEALDAAREEMRHAYEQDNLELPTRVPILTPPLFPYAKPLLEQMSTVAGIPTIAVTKGPWPLQWKKVFPLLRDNYLGGAVITTGDKPEALRRTLAGDTPFRSLIHRAQDAGIPALMISDQLRDALGCLAEVPLDKKIAIVPDNGSYHPEKTRQAAAGKNPADMDPKVRFPRGAHMLLLQKQALSPEELADYFRHITSL